MATQTTNYKLTKPDITDKVDVTVLNGNADIIDQALQGLKEGKQDGLTFDTEPTAGSENPVTSDGLKKAFDQVQSSLNFDQTPTAGSKNPVTSGGIKNYVDTAVAGVDVSAQLATKQDVLTWDQAPTAGSQNPVTSDGVFQANRSVTEDVSDLRIQIEAVAAGFTWQAAVDNFDAIAATYPSPEPGWAVTVKDTGFTYYYNGTAWILVLINTTRYMTAAEARAILEG